MKIENTKACFVCLWRLLRSTRRLFREQYTLFCIRRILQAWFGDEATDDFIWEVCTLCEQVGWDKLPSPTRSPRKHRELLRAIVATRLGIGLRKVHLSDLDSAYSTAFPNSTPICKKAFAYGYICRASSRNFAFSNLSLSFSSISSTACITIKSNGSYAYSINPSRFQTFASHFLSTAE